MNLEKKPPPALLEPTPHPEYQEPVTPRELVRLVGEYNAALNKCNADKEALGE